MVNESFAKLFRQHNPTEQLPNELFFGIFNDFHYRPLTTKTGPLVFNSIYASPSDTGDAYIRISGKDTKAALQYIEQCFSEIFPDEVYNLNFLDEKYENLYFKEKLFQSQLTTFSILAIIISCLGLFALISHSIEQHKKEIALRKVYGSSVTGIVSLLLTRFLRWILFSFIIAVPIVWYLIHKWLEQFAYHIDINWTPFLSAGGITFIIAILTVLYQSYSAAKANPIKAIKTE